MEDIKCSCCDYEGNLRKWSHIEIGSIGYTFLYDIEKDTKERDTGSIKFLVCPKCKTVKFGY